MIDFHSHILPNIDDGSRSMEESINLIREATEAGFTGIISTSHYLQDYYECDEQERRKLIDSIANETAKLSNNIGRQIPKLYLGSEIYITTDMINLLEEKKASTINNTKYVLFELPMNSKPLFVKDVVYKLIECGYRPIIAHPERYSYVKEDIGFVKELKDMGALFQSNYGSIIGMYGNSAKKTVKKLLKENLISFLGSDVHKTGQIYSKIPKILKKLNRWIPSDMVQNLTTFNAQKVLENQEI